MSPRRINHFDPGIFGKYRGHSIIHEEGDSLIHDPGEIEHFVNDGSIIPGERYVGHSVIAEGGEVRHFKNDGDIFPGERYVGRSVIENPRGGGGGGSFPDLSGAWVIVLPLLIVIGILALATCPALWLLWRLFRKERKNEHQAQPRFKGIGWMILASFMAQFGLGLSLAVIFVVLTGSAGLLSGAPSSPSPSVGDVLSLIMFASWAISLLLGAFNIFRENFGSRRGW